MVTETSRSTRVKACHLTSVHAHNDVRILVKECASLAACGFEVHLVASGTEDKEYKGVRIHGVETPRSRLARATRTAWQVFSKAREVNADVYHFHDSELLPVGLLLSGLGKRVIYDSHEDLPRQILYKTYIPVYIRRPLAWFAEKFEDFAARKFDCVIGATPTIRDRFLNEGCRAVDILNFPLLSEFALREADWSRKERAVCYVGGITPERGIREIVSSLRAQPVKLLLGGNFESERLRNDVGTLPEWKQVEHLGFVSRQGVAEIFARSMAGLVVLYPEANYLASYPIKMFEYMAAGLPVIASDFPLWRSLIEEVNCALFVDPRNPDEIGKAIRWVMEHPAEAEIMGQRGRQAVMEKFNWTAEEKKLVACYKNVVGGSETP